MAKSAEDISKALQLAQKYKVDIAVRGGGHSPSGSNSSEGGLVIDLSSMRQVTVDDKSKTAKCQGGCLWEDVDQALGMHGLATVSGTVSHTGIAGLTLGGGYGWLSGQYGLVIENLLSVKVVLADGRIVLASETENQDLFWALRGAGHNFGVAVEFTYQAHDLAHNVYAGLLLFDEDKLEEIIKFNNTLTETPDEKAGVIMTVARPPGQPSPILACALFYDGAEELGKQKFGPLFNLEPFGNTVTMRPYTEVNSMVNENASFGGWKSFHGASFPSLLEPKFGRRILNEFSATLEQNPELGSSVMQWEFHNLDKVYHVPQTTTAFAKRGPHRNVVLIIEHDNPARHDEFRECGRRIQNIFLEELVRTEKGYAEGDVAIYGNYVDGTFYILAREALLPYLGTVSLLT